MLSCEAPLKDGRIMFRVKGLPRPKPRQTQRDRFAPSRSVQDYRFWADLIRTHWQSLGWKEPWEGGISLSCIFEFPIPDSWSQKKKKLALEGKIDHTSPPDLDNLVKGVADALNKLAWKDDCQISNYFEPMTKLWAPVSEAGVWITIERIGDPHDNKT